MAKNDWVYSADGLQRSRRRDDGSLDVQSVPCNLPADHPQKDCEVMTQQQFKDDCDVNVILERILKTGQMPVWSSGSGVYADLTELPGSYKEALDVVLHAEAAFEELPAKVKAKFEQDPQKLMDFLADEKNRSEAEELGLVVKKTVDVAPVVPAPPPVVPPAVVK